MWTFAARARAGPRHRVRCGCAIRPLRSRFRGAICARSGERAPFLFALGVRRSHRLPRTRRGEVGAIAVSEAPASSALLSAARSRSGRRAARVRASGRARRHRSVAACRPPLSTRGELELVCRRPASTGHRRTSYRIAERPRHSHVRRRRLEVAVAAMRRRRTRAAAADPRIERLRVRRGRRRGKRRRAARVRAKPRRPVSRLRLRCCSAAAGRSWRASFTPGLPTTAAFGNVLLAQCWVSGGRARQRRSYGRIFALDVALRRRSRPTRGIGGAGSSDELRCAIGIRRARGGRRAAALLTTPKRDSASSICSARRVSVWSGPQARAAIRRFSRCSRAFRIRRRRESES